MTTIAYKDGVIAYESRQTRGDFISSDNENKKTAKDGVLFFIAGRIGESKKLIDAYLCGDIEHDNNVWALVVDNGVVYSTGFTDGKLWRCEENNNYAIGSGCDYAIGAMDAGATAKEAVKIAIGRDPFSGGKIKSYKI